MIRLLIFMFLLRRSTAGDESSKYLDENARKGFEHCENDDCDALERCDLSESIRAFKEKRLVKPISTLASDPYEKKMDVDELRIIRSYVENSRMNCGVRYLDRERISYELRTFPTENSTAEANFIITHYGRCGGCSSLQDLGVYLRLNKNLTVLARQCALFTVVSDSLSAYCFRRLGFSESCLQMWLFNAKNTRRHCWWPCLKSWFFGEPHNVKKDGEAGLNDCLRCDEDKSGLLFKYYAGRTRRNSGVSTAVERPSDESACLRSDIDFYFSSFMISVGQLDSARFWITPVDYVAISLQFATGFTLGVLYSLEPPTIGATMEYRCITRGFYNTGFNDKGKW